MNPTLTASPGSSARIGLLLFLVVWLLAVPQAALMPLLDRDEPRFAEASREMRQSGNYVVPTFNHEPRYAKPPMIYWCQVLCFEVLGENPFAARLPSLLATAGTAWLLFLWGTSLGQRAVGSIAALSYGCCVQAMQQGRVATADALLVFFMTLTGLAGWKLLTLAKQEPPATARAWNGWGIVLALAFGGGFLAKGPEALLPFIPLMLMGRSLGRRVLLSFTAILALGLFIVAWWAIPAYQQTHGEYWHEGLGKDVGERMVIGFEGHGASNLLWYLLTVPFYFVVFWWSALPWSPLPLIHRKRLFSSWKADEADLYLLFNAGLIFLIFSLMVTKLPHYTLPAFPFLVLFFARRWISAGLAPELPLKLNAKFGLALALMASLGIPLLLWNSITPSPVGVLVREAQGHLSPTTEFALVDFREPNAIWEMRRAVNGYGQFISEADVLPFLKQPGSRAVILTTQAWRKLSTDGNPGWKTFEAHGFNTAKFSPLKKTFDPFDLTLVTTQ